MSGLTKSLFHAGPQQRRWLFLTYVISVILARIHKQGRALVRFQLYQIWLGIAQPRWGFQGDLQYHIQTNESALQIYTTMSSVSLDLWVLSCCFYRWLSKGHQKPPQRHARQVNGWTLTCWDMFEYDLSNLCVQHWTSERRPTNSN